MTLRFSKGCEIIKTLYDVQQLLEKFGVIVSVGKRLWDIEVMALEIDHLHDSHVITQRQFLNAKLILHHEHHVELVRAAKRNENTGGI